jgi:hypothetical protein
MSKGAYKRHGEVRIEKTKKIFECCMKKFNGISSYKSKFFFGIFDF